LNRIFYSSLVATYTTYITYTKETYSMPSNKQ